MEYVQKTIAAYDQNPQEFIGRTKDLSYTAEIDEFAKLLPSNGFILDAGCAFGRDTKKLAEKGFRIIGIDLSQNLLKHAREFLPQAQFLQMDVRNLKFTNNNFDGIWCHATLLHLKNEDLKKTLKEFYRVIKEKGILYVSFKEGKGTEELEDSFSKDSSKFYQYQTVESVGGLLKEAGFKPIKIVIVNEKEKFGKDKRDLNWVCAFARK